MYPMTAILFLELCIVFRPVQPVYCPNPPPGLEGMCRAVDITKLDLLPLETLTDNGFGRRVIDLTCDKGRKWTSPFNDKLTYDLPDQVETINAIPGGVVDASYNIFRDYKEVKKSMSANVGVSFLSGMFSSSASYKKIQHAITNSSKTISTLSGYFSAIQADFVPSWEQTLKGSARSFIDKRLPNEFTDNPELFNEFLRIFGTHFFGTGRFGGVYKLTIDMESGLSNQMSDSDIEVNAKATFFKLLKANGAYQSSNTEINDQFQSKSRLTSRYFGGNANLFAADSWQNWWPTVPANPWLFGGKLEPITNLLEDGPKKKAIKNAIQVYLDKAQLQDLQRTLGSFFGKGRKGDESARNLSAQVVALQAQVVPDHATVLSLGDQIHDLLIPPEWFMKQTQLCYSWYPNLHDDQCSAPSRNMCARPNQMTPFYRDNSDRTEKGGCWMQWGLRAIDTPDWFSKVKVCFRGEADGRRFRQCGNGETLEACVPVGQSTPWWLDHTDKRAGGCQMKWRLEVPTDAPVWMLNTKLCFSWYPDGDPTQCGGGVDRDLCAEANQWTQNYRDDTDQRSGGCQMSWGIKTMDQ